MSPCPRGCGLIPRPRLLDSDAVTGGLVRQKLLGSPHPAVLVPPRPSSVRVPCGCRGKRVRVCVCACVCVCVCVLSHVRLCASPWTVARRAPLSVGFPRQEHWSGLPFPSPGESSRPGTELESPVPPALAGGLFTTEQPGKPRGKSTADLNERRDTGVLFSHLPRCLQPPSGPLLPQTPCSAPPLTVSLC